jgi:hypothetical protein
MPRLVGRGDPISHNTVRQLLLWYAANRATIGAIMALFNCSDGLIQFRIHRVEALSQ